MPLHIYVPCWDVARMYFRPNMGNGQFHDVKLNWKAMMFYIYMKMHIHKQAKFQLD